MNLVFEMDDRGFFRLRTDDWLHVGFYTGYTSVASLEIGDRKFIAVSGYYEGILPIECALEIKVQATKKETHAGSFSGVYP